MAPTKENTTAKSGEISIKDLIFGFYVWKKYLLSKWKMVLIVSLVCALMGLFFSIFKKPIYKAELTFALQDDNTSGNMGGLASAAGIASQFGVNLGMGNAGGAFSGDNIMELMKSRSMVETTLLTPVYVQGRNETLAELYIAFNRYRDHWNSESTLRDIHFSAGEDRSKFTLLQDSVLGAFYHTIIKKNLVVEKEDKKLSIISVKVDSKNELFSKYFTEILVKTVSDFYIDTKTKRSSENVSILQRQTDSVRKELNSAITGTAALSDINPNPNPALQIIRAPSQRRQVDVQADIAIMTELVKNLELSKMALRKETPLIQIIDRPILPLEKEHISKISGILFGGLVGALLMIIIAAFQKVVNDITQ